MKLGITVLIHNKDDIQFVTEFPCFLGHPVTRLHSQGAINRDYKIRVSGNCSWFLLKQLKFVFLTLKICLDVTLVSPAPSTGHQTLFIREINLKNKMIKIRILKNRTGEFRWLYSEKSATQWQNQWLANKINLMNISHCSILISLLPEFVVWNIIDIRYPVAK